MKKLVIALFALSLGLFSIPSYAIWEGAVDAPDFFEINKNKPDVAKEEFIKAMEAEKKSDWKRIIRSQPEVFDMTIDGKTRECYYEGKNIICE